MKTRVRLLAVLVGGAVGVCMTGSPVFAGEPAGAATAEQTASAIRHASGVGPERVIPGSGSSYNAKVGGQTVAVDGAAGRIRVGTAAGESTVLGLPDVAGGQPVRAHDGTVVRTGRDASTAVRVLTDGTVQAFVTLADARAATTYPFTFDLPAGRSIRPDRATGGLYITNQDGSAVTGYVDTPWAKDAAGRPLTTSYTVQGSTVIQHIDTTNARYPVVADPSFHTNCSVTCRFYFTRSSTHNMYDTMNSIGAGSDVLAGLFCVALPIPANLACAAAVLIYSAWAAYELTAASNRNGCFVVEVNYVEWITSQGPWAVSFDDVPASSKWCYA